MFAEKLSINENRKIATYASLVFFYDFVDINVGLN